MLRGLLPEDLAEYPRGHDVSIHDSHCWAGPCLGLPVTTTVQHQGVQNKGVFTRGSNSGNGLCILWSDWTFASMQQGRTEVGPFPVQGWIPREWHLGCAGPSRQQSRYPLSPDDRQAPASPSGRDAPLEPRMSPDRSAVLKSPATTAGCILLYRAGFPKSLR